MKFLPAFFAVLLGTLTLAHGQSEGKKAKVNSDEIVLLVKGSLVQVVNDIESRIIGWPRSSEGETWVMPNTLFSKEALEAVVPGDLRLRGVSPLEAVAFAAAAAGCVLEPIFVPSENSNGIAQKVAGYRIVMGKPVTPAPSQEAITELTGVTAISGKLNEAVIHPATPPAGRVGGVTLSGGKLNVSGSGGAVSKQGGPTASSVRSEEETLRPSVRVNAMGSFLSGSEKEVADKKRQLSELIELALKAAGSDGRGLPDLSFHVESGTLIVRAIEAQHEIIEQVIRALKENESVAPAPGKP